MLNAPFCLGSLYRSFACVQSCLSVAGDSSFRDQVEQLGFQSWGDPRTRNEAGKVVAIDERNRTIDLKRGASSSVPHPTALVPFDIVDATVLRDSLLRLASWVIDHGIAGSESFQSARELLLRQRPRVLRDFHASLIGEDGNLTEGAKALVRSLAREPSVLPIQGPPGSGKTFTGGRMIVELVAQGRRVGVTAASHKVARISSCNL